MTAPPRSSRPRATSFLAAVWALVAPLASAQASSCAAPEPQIIPRGNSPLAPTPTQVAPDGGPDGRDAATDSDASPPHVEKIAECRREDWSASISVAHICEDSAWKCTVPDCKGGQIEVPYWLRGVHFWDILCVNAEGRKEVVNYGDTLMSKAEIEAGDPRSQGYYALSQPPPIDPGTKQYVWAVCGGGGGQLTFGTQVLVMPGLPDKKAIELAEYVEVLMEAEKDIQFFRTAYCGAPPDTKKEYLQRLQTVRGFVDESAARLRAGIMGEHRLMLKP